MPGADSAATTQGAPRREPRLPRSCCASPSPPLQPRKCASCPRPPANHAHGRRTRAGRTHARAACGPVCCHGAVPTPAHSAASARPGRWQQGGGWGGRALLLVLEVRAGVEAGAAGATQAWRAGEGCCQRWRRCSGLPPGSSGRLFPEAWLDPALAMTSSPPADELKQIRVILGLRSQGCYSPLPPGLKPTLSRSNSIKSNDGSGASAPASPQNQPGVRPEGWTDVGHWTGHSSAPQTRPMRHSAELGVTVVVK